MAARTKADRIFDALVVKLTGINGSAAASSTIAVNASIGATTITVADGSDFSGENDAPLRKRVIIIGQDAAREEVQVVTGVSVNDLTITPGLVYAHTLAQADAVKQYWYNHTVNHLRSWSELQNGPEGTLPAAGLMTVDEDILESASNDIEYLRRKYRSMLVDQVAISEPYDQANDRKYQRLLADHEHAIMDDHTLGGLSVDINILSRTPLDETDIAEGSEIPLVGSQIDFEVVYSHLIGQLYW